MYIDIQTLVAVGTFCFLIEERIRSCKREKLLLDRTITFLLYKIGDAQRGVRYKERLDVKEIFDTITQCEMGIGLFERIFSLSVYKYEQGNYVRAYDNYQRTRSKEDYSKLLAATYMYARAILSCLRFE